MRADADESGLKAPTTLISRVNSKELFFLVVIFRCQNKGIESVNNAESHDLKILIQFSGKPILDFFKCEFRFLF